MLFIGCTQRRGDTIVIASKDFTEQDILGYIKQILINENTDLNTRLVNNLGSWIIYEAIKSGEVALYSEYCGTIYGNYFGYTETKSPEEIFAIARAGMKERYNILMLDKIGFNNTYTLSVRPDTAQRFNMRTISDLARVASQLTLGGTMEFVNREDGLLGLKRVYNMAFRNEITIEGALRYTAISNDEVQVTDAFSTDGMLLRYELVVLEDDRDFFPPYHAAVLIRQDIAEKHPQLVEILNRLIGTLNDDSMRQLNYRVDVRQESPESVARSFLREAGLIR
jgi:osmoprotectant transport system permease protein